jgi:hypothetical protein
MSEHSDTRPTVEWGGGSLDRANAEEKAGSRRRAPSPTAASGRNQTVRVTTTVAATMAARGLRTTRAAGYPDLGPVAANDRHPDLASISSE